ncbi:MAG: hypothetical protein GXY14_13245 [Spirochaetes bacterium]|nr:hypothetical protein [Spirochaetota bacterium]
MNRPGDVTLCQPDNDRGCSVCCGLFNFMDCTRENLSAFLQGGSSRAGDYAVYEDFRLDAAVRDPFTHICPYQGFISAGKPGCHIHPLSSGSEGRERSLFSSKICSGFLCPAHKILTPGEKETLVEHVKDWYLYSVAICDPESFSFLQSHITDTYRIKPHDPETGILLNTGLAAHAGLLAQSSGVIFYYSQPEYNLHKGEFCVRYNMKNREPVVEGIRKRADHLISPR